MRLTTAELERFKGGQAEIQNGGEGYIYRGEIAEAKVEGDDVKIRFAWLAKGKGFPPQGWENHTDLEYGASLSIYAVSNIGPSSDNVGGGNRLCLNSATVGETTVLFPPNGSKLDPAKVEGLQPVQT